MALALAASEVRAYYVAALGGLAYVEGRKPTDRRFGPNADARWSSFAGDLTTADRLDLLLRDADAQWAGAFGPRTVFSIRAAAEDDPFGAEWAPLDPIDGEALWREALAKTVPAEVQDALLGVAAAWKVAVAPTDSGSIGPADKLLVAGPGAIVATAAAFARGSDLDWPEQVVCIATPPAHRQIAALGAAMLNAARACPILAADAIRSDAARTLRLGVRRVLMSDDADAVDAAAARAVGELAGGEPQGDAR